ncbi:hypothetical protein NADE_000561 [Nannochloris sp. 'desiccata']|nr:hypothetical protein KSW81_004677 [Chlorella desiccata (nom. nud.)]KAH7618367.1 hypothetical protein NADE_000561 [Chlorella desiccata (nom. nud.)]
MFQPSRRFYPENLKAPAIEVLQTLGDLSDVGAPSVEVRPMPVNLLPIPASTSSPASDVPAPTSVIPGGCPGLSIALRFENYTVDTFGSAQLATECFVYSAINLGYVCSNTATECILNRGCFVDSTGKEYLKHLFADSFTCSARTPSSPPLLSSREVEDILQEILVEIMDITAPNPESEGNDPTISPSPDTPPTTPLSRSAAPPSSIPTPSPPVTPSVCTYIGTYRLQSVACPGKYIAVFPSCNEKSVVLRRSMQAPGARIHWNLNTTAVDKVGFPAPIASLRNCPVSSRHLTSPSGTRQPTLGGSSWRFQVVPSSSSCGTVNIMANNRLSSAPFLSVGSTCDSFVWSSSGRSTSAEFKAIRA